MAELLAKNGYARVTRFEHPDQEWTLAIDARHRAPKPAAETKAIVGVSSTAAAQAIE
jgi:hypothetical protein